MCIDEVILKKLKTVAEKSNVNSRHSCALVVDNNIITLGFNRYCNNKKYSNTIHAEIDALFKLKTKIKTREKVDIIIIRLSNYNNEILKNSKPCNHCIIHLKKYHESTKIFINRIYYSNEHGEIVHDTLDNICNNHISSGRGNSPMRRI